MNFDKELESGKESIDFENKKPEERSPLEQSNVDFAKEIEPAVVKVNSMINDLEGELLSYDPSDVLKRKLMDAKFNELQSKIRGLTFNPKVSVYISEKFKLKEINSNYFNLLDKKETKEREVTDA